MKKPNICSIFTQDDDGVRWRMILLTHDDSAKFMVKLANALKRPVMSVGGFISKIRRPGEKSSRYGHTEHCLTGKLLAPSWMLLGSLRAEESANAE